ncbi:patatin-like phospholipase family protein [Reichenbachiella versicolor]|uniref:patatin-like phospholipase family protein n=1 Tax=Reichenbachiella versicolor TaxID=1821036 RepID=UPI000D6DE025|nr:patatin-like phospholipase family protein [Reichenbachiella versicolor]
MKKVGLALGGGAVLGAAHIGVIKALEEADIEVVKITGTSIGAFVASLYAFGKSCEEMEKIGLDLDWADIAKVKLSKNALFSNEKLGKLVSQYIGDRKIEESNIPLSLVATDVTNGEKVMLNKGTAAVQALEKLD